MATWEDSKVQRMVAARQAVERATVWKMQIGGLSIRCVHTTSGVYRLDVKGNKGWTEGVTRMTTPEALMRSVMEIESVKRALKQTESVEALTAPQPTC